MFMSLQRVKLNGDVSSHPSLTLSYIKNNPSINLDSVIRNQSFTWHWVKELSDRRWNFSLLSESPHFTWKWVEAFPDKKWNWVTLSNRVNDVSQILAFPDGSWDWDILTLNKNILLSQMIEHSNLPWRISRLEFEYIDENVIAFIRHFRFHYTSWTEFTRCAPWDIIKTNMDLPWRLDMVTSYHICEDDMDIVYKYKNNWNWKLMSEYVDFKIIKNHRDLPWIDEYVSRNKSVTYIDTIHTKWITWNYMYISLEEEKRRWISARIIQRWWLHIRHIRETNGDK
jgi:hypothetical protein